ncbi:MAG: PAS domain S-box protein, partial [Desulfobacteraceae bacterium]|nr:PAS domain S-box protein [Desulfobacteraceae bacterium]
TMIPESVIYINKMISSNFFGKYEVIAQKKDKTTFPAELQSAGMEFHGEKVRIVSIRDVSEYKKTQEEIAKLRNFLRSIIDSMPSFIAGVNTKGMVTAWNTEAEKLTGVLAKDAMEKPLETILSNIGIKIPNIKEAVSSGVIKKFQKVPVLKNGKEYFFDISIYPLAQGFEGAAIRADDITEKILLEEMLIQSEKMLSVGGLAAGMAHEINNPLAGVLQNLQVIEYRFKPDKEKNLEAAKDSGVSMTAMQKYLEKREIFSLMDSIFNSGSRAATIVRDMLSFARKSESSFIKNDLQIIMDTTIELAEKEYDLKKKFDFKAIK